MVNVSPDAKRTINRRNFLIGAATLSAGNVLATYDRILSGLLGTEYTHCIDEAKEYILARHGIEIPKPASIGTLPKGLSVTEPNKYELSRGLGLVMEELIKYPPLFLRQNGIKKIIFFSSIWSDEERLMGFASVSEECIAMCYNAEFFEHRREEYRRALHHELYHRFERFHNSVESENGIWKDFHSQDGYPQYQIYMPEENELPDNYFSYFSSKYGSTEPIEDRAGFAEQMMVSELYIKLLDRIQSEGDRQILKILLQKYEAMLGYYREWSGGLMDLSFWEDLKNDRITEGYFN